MYKITIEKNKKVTCVLVKEKDINNQKLILILFEKCINSLNGIKGDPKLSELAGQELKKRGLLTDKEIKLNSKKYFKWVQ